MNKNLLKYGITTIVGLVASFGIMWYRGVFSNGNDLQAIMSDICDGFFVTGMLMFLFGALIWASSTGIFDGLTYGIQFFIQKILPLYRQEYKSYYDYKAEKAEKRHKGSTVFMLIVGLAFIAVSVIILILYYNV